MEQLIATADRGAGDPWYKGKLVGQKAPLRLKEIWRSTFACEPKAQTRSIPIGTPGKRTSVAGSDGLRRASGST
jgi:hypothetical protein